MIRITDELHIDEAAITLDFVRASGPGGQNVNKVSSAVQLRFDTAGLPGDVRHRLRALAGSRLTKDGVVVLEAQRFRSQERNREDALERLVELLRQAAVRPKRRIKTRPTKGSKQRRLEGKRRRSETKQGRGAVRDA
jgi:ribosome-associated protein